MNLLDKPKCLLCGSTIRRNQLAAVIANVLIAHQECVEGRNH